MKRALRVLTLAALLALALYAIDVTWGLAHLPPEDNFCAGAGETLKPDPQGGWWCSR